MKYIFIVSWTSCFNYLDSRTYISLKTGALKSKKIYNLSFNTFSWLVILPGRSFEDAAIFQ